MPPKGENPSDSLFTKIKTYSGEIKKFGKDFFVASLGAAALMGAACSPSGEASNEPSPDLPAATATATPGETATEPTETPTETSTSKPSATDSETTPSSKPSVVASETTSPTTAPSAPRETISPTEIESDIPEYLQGIDNINIDSVLEGTEFQKLSPEEQEKFREIHAKIVSQENPYDIVIHTVSREKFLEKEAELRAFSELYIDTYRDYAVANIHRYGKAERLAKVFPYILEPVDENSRAQSIDDNIILRISTIMHSLTNEGNLKVNATDTQRREAIAALAGVVALDQDRPTTEPDGLAEYYIDRIQNIQTLSGDVGLMSGLSDEFTVSSVLSEEPAVEYEDGRTKTYTIISGNQDLGVSTLYVPYTNPLNGELDGSWQIVKVVKSQS